jgi:hypothetical protein
MLRKIRSYLYCLAFVSVSSIGLSNGAGVWNITLPTEVIDEHVEELNAGRAENDLITQCYTQHKGSGQIFAGPVVPALAVDVTFLDAMRKCVTNYKNNSPCKCKALHCSPVSVKMNYSSWKEILKWLTETHLRDAVWKAAQKCGK